MVQAAIHTLQNIGTLTARFTASGSNTAQERISTEQIQLTGNSYMPTATVIDPTHFLT
jgi:hypothetical protein